jgi:lipopolysaccharide export system permease protein
MKIYQRAAIREFSQTAVAAFTALLAILMTIQLIRLLGQAAGGKLAADAVMALMVFGVIGYLPVLLSIAIFIAVLLTLSRWYRDSEMVIWQAAGMPLSAWILPVLKFSLPVVVVIAALSLVLGPWATQKGLMYRQKVDDRGDVARVSPGEFNESSSGDRVFFVESVAGQTGIVKNVFVNSVQQGQVGVMATALGHTETAENGDKFLVLEKGRRYEGVAGTPAYRVMAFDRYAIRIETKESQKLESSPRTKSLVDLLKSPTPSERGELLWRLGLPLAAFNLAMLAIPFSYVNARAGRTNNLFFALLTYMLYNNLISVSQAWVAQGRLRFGIGVWLIHALVLLLLLALFCHRQNPFLLAGRKWH